MLRSPYLLAEAVLPVNDFAFDGPTDEAREFLMLYGREYLAFDLGYRAAQLYERKISGRDFPEDSFSLDSTLPGAGRDDYQLRNACAETKDGFTARAPPCFEGNIPTRLVAASVGNMPLPVSREVHRPAALDRQLRGSPDRHPHAMTIPAHSGADTRQRYGGDADLGNCAMMEECR